MIFDRSQAARWDGTARTIRAVVNRKQILAKDRLGEGNGLIPPSARSAWRFSLAAPQLVAKLADDLSEEALADQRGQRALVRTRGEHDLSSAAKGARSEA